MRRRSLFPLFGGAMLSAAASRFDPDPSLVVAGPAGGDLEQWATLLAPSLAGALTEGGELRLRHVGTRDGVTGLNQFQAWAEPDGASALLFPGEAALAAMAGDDRVRFDVFRLVPVLAITSSALLMWRGPSRSVRLACPAGVRPLLPGLLALHLLGVQAEIARGSQDEVQAVTGGAADAVFLVGEDVPARAAMLRRAGLVPLLCADAPEGGRDPAFPGVPSLFDLRFRRSGIRGALADAWAPAVLATQLRAVLALPALSPATRIARWRRAARAALDSAGPIAAGGLTLQGPQAAPGLMTGLASGPDAQAALRAWIARNDGWQMPTATLRDSLFIKPRRAN